MRRNQEYNDKALTGLYHSNKQAREILNVLASLPRQEETLIETIEKRVPEISRRDIVTIFKQLQDFGIGEFLPGRRGHSSRFRWDIDSVYVATLEAPLPGEKREPLAHHPQEDGAANQSTAVVIAHRFQLRPDFAVSLNLPTDITPAEATRLCQFIQSLPFV